MRRALPLLLIPVLLAAACATPQGPGAGGPTGSPSGGPIPDRFDPSGLMLRVESAGGLVPAGYIYTEYPMISVYGDGRVITQGAVPAIYPGPALPNLQVRQITQDGVAELMRLAGVAGVGRSADYGVPSVADVPTTYFTVASSQGMLESAVPALGFDIGLTPEQRAARQPLVALVDSLQDLPATLGPDAGPAESPYEPRRVAIFALPWTDPADHLEHPQVAWPGPELPGTQMEWPPPAMPRPLVYCFVVTGDEMVAVLEAARWPNANYLTPWVWDSSPYFVRFRPLLPDETRCMDLA